jgi:hypothetical protein
LNCIPSSVALNLPKVIPNPVPGEFHGIKVTDHMGNLLLRPPSKQVKDVYELAKVNDEFSAIISYRDRLRDVLLEGVPVQWNKRCVGFEETNDGVWAIFEDGSREFGDILVGSDGINSPGKLKFKKHQSSNFSKIFYRLFDNNLVISFISLIIYSSKAKNT